MTTKRATPQAGSSTQPSTQPIIELPNSSNSKPTSSSKIPGWAYVVLSLALMAVLAGVWLIYDAIDNQRIDAESVVFKEDLTAEFGDQVKASDFLQELKGELVDDYEVSTDELGAQEIAFTYINRKNRKRTIKFNVEVVDTIKPEIFGRGSYSVNVGYAGDLTDLMLSGDNLDDHPARKIEGEYDLSKAGEYDLEYVITDASGNQNRQPFVLYVVEPTQNNDVESTNPAETPKLELNDVIKQYKKTNTKIGIDVSVWQGEIDWSAVKAAGVEFAFIRVGYQNDYDGENILDKRFADNIAGATAAGLPIGVYFYSYAQSPAQAQSQAEWIREQIGDYQLDLGIAFDWENWDTFNTAGMSFRTLNQLFESFSAKLNEYGYSTKLYSSKYYLENLWQAADRAIWLAQYYDYVTYAGDYEIWQMSDIGVVKGISGYVDIDIMYLE